MQESESISDSKSEQENKEVVGDDRSCSGTEEEALNVKKKTAVSKQMDSELGHAERENVVNLNKGLSSRVVSEDKVNDNDIGFVDLKVGPEGISSQFPEPSSVNTNKKVRNLDSKIEAHSLKKS
ncbi:hypothetical protein V6N13_013235 [Hibiscus sabdariffa]